jgi:hypothetical protein
MGHFFLLLLGSILVVFMGVLVNYWTHDYADPTGKKRQWVLAGIVIIVFLTAVLAWMQQPETTPAPAAAGAIPGKPARDVVAAASSPTVAALPSPAIQHDHRIAPVPPYRSTVEARTEFLGSQPNGNSYPSHPLPRWPSGATDRQQTPQPTSSAPEPQTTTPLQTARTANGKPPNPETISVTISAPVQGCESHSIDVDSLDTLLNAEVKNALRPKFKVEAELCNSMKSIVIRLRSFPRSGGRKLEPDRPMNLAEAKTERSQARSDADFDQALRRNTADETDQYRS